MTAIAVAGPFAGHADIVVVAVLGVRFAGAFLRSANALSFVAEELARPFSATSETKPSGAGRSLVAAVKDLGPVFRRFEQVAHGRHRAVVQIGRAQPDAVERQVGVAVGLAEMREALVGIGGVEISLLRRERVRVIVEAARVGADLGDRLDLADPAAREIAARWRRGSRRNIRAYKTLPRAASSASIGNGYFGGLLASERSQSAMKRNESRSIRVGTAPVPNAALRLRSSTLSLLPSQCSRILAADARTLQPKRRKIDDADRFARRQFFDRPVQEGLGRAERIEAAGSRRHLVGQKAKTIARQDQRLAHRRHRGVLQQQPVDQGIMRPGTLGGLHDLPWVEAFVESAVGQELREARRDRAGWPACRRQ